MEKKLIIIILIAILLRLYPFNFYGFQGSDPYVHFAVANYFDKYRFSTGYALSNYPDSVTISEPFGLYMIPMAIHYIIPSTLITVFQITPIIFAVISILVSYLLFTEIFDRRTGVITTAFVSFSIANMTRTGFGVYRGEMLMIPFLLASLFFLVKGMKIKNWKKEQIIERTILFSISGILLGTTSFVWYGYSFSFVTMLVTLLVLIIYGFFKNNMKRSIMAFVVVLLISLLFTKLFVFFGLLPEEHRFTEIYMPYLFVLLMALASILHYFGHKLNKRNKLIVVAVLLILIPVSFVIRPDLLGIFTGFGAAIPTGAYHQSIQELQQPTLEFLFLTLDITLVLAILGAIVVVLKTIIEPDWKRMVFFGFALTSIYLSLSALRFIFLGSFAFSALSAYFFAELFKEKKTQKRNAVLLLVVFAVMFIHTVQVRSQLEFNTHWEDALLWIKTNVGLSDGVATWRDDGGIIQAFAERATTVDSVFGQEGAKLREITNLILLNTTQNISAQYVVFDKNRIIDLQGIANMMSTPGDFSLIELGITVENDIVQTYPTNFMINMTSKKAYADSISLDLIILNGTEFSHYPAPDLRIEGALLLQTSNAFYLSEDLYQSNFVKMTMLDGLEGYKLVYRDPRISIYEFCSRTGCI